MRFIKANVASLALLMSVQPIIAKQLHPAEALDRVLEDCNITITRTSLSPTPVATINAAENPEFKAIYVFSTEPGFIIISADDCGAPLLGYSNTGNFNIKENPELSYWLDFYASQIKFASDNNILYNKIESRADSWNPVVPLLTSQWNQNSPFNNMCPEFSGRYSMTGCVATAMAQVMYYHQWPDICQGGILEYRSQFANYQTSLYLDFDDTRFNWNEMLDLYHDEEYSEENAEAVAQLMMACGYALETNYSPGFSAAYASRIASSLYKYFNYSQSVQMPQREYYTDQEWEELIYNQLSQGLPVMYGGYTENDEGHQFVCDGYDGKGYFHINWGWGGLSDGYYLLSALTPENQGIGGSTSGYNYEQEVTINISRPDVQVNGATKYLMYCMSNFSIKELGEDPEPDATATVRLGSRITLFPALYKGIQNNSSVSVTGEAGILIEGSDGSKQESYTSELTIEPWFHYYLLEVVIPNNLSAGSYKIYPIFKINGEEDYIFPAVPVGCIDCLYMVVENGKATISPSEIETDTGIENLWEESEGAETEYFDITGRKINSPLKGQLLIGKKGKEFKKIIY
ncbi:MAG: C10 family peptidase [Muribaculaceae bacterium]|nr:C10 family peptidase [Muribaculaceae bacterium]